MSEANDREVRIRELVSVLELTAIAHRNAPTSLAAEVERRRWYSALRELGELNRQERTCTDAPRALGAAAGSNR